MKAVILFISSLLCIALASCATTTEYVESSQPIEPLAAAFAEPEQKQIVIEEPEVIFVSSDESKDEKSLKDGEAVAKNYQDKLILPEYADGRMKAWYYKKGDIYQLQTQTFHSSIIQLEPGEKLTEEPYISEPQVWRISRGVSYLNGMATHIILVKPDYTNLKSTLILLTDKRVYQLELTSHKDRYMPYVEWVYSRNIEELDSWKTWKAQKDAAENPLRIEGLNVENISVDYKIRYSQIRPPIWKPSLVCDDGAKTYIVLDKKTLHMTFPAVFKKNREIVNKEIRKNVIVLNELIEKVTLRLGRQKVTIIKKKSK